MLKLLLLRHAKSGWDDAALSDHERPLSKRGAKAAPLMGRFIAKSEHRPERVLCSDAVRTRATLTLLLPELGAPPPQITYDSALYLASAPDIMAFIRAHAGDATCVMVIGHNPGMHALALALVGSGDRMAMRDMSIKYPTAALAVITFPVDSWDDVGPAAGRLDVFQTPRALV